MIKTTDSEINSQHFGVKLPMFFSSFDNILGYELFNEPWFGNIYEDSLLLLECVADRIKLQPLYD
jgi:hypothetical protein